MGSWGTRFDENDGGLDFIGEIEDEMEWGVVSGRILDYVADDGYEGAEETIAAIEVLAAALGAPSPALETNVAEWALTQSARAEELRDRGVAAIETILDSSELAELWAESDDNEEWREELRKLQARLLQN